MTQTASFSSDTFGDQTEVLTLNGDCDLPTALHADQRIVSALDAGRTEIIFDLRGVTSLDHSMLQMFFRALLRIGPNGRLDLIRPNAHVWARFEESGLDHGFSTFSDLTGVLAEAGLRADRDGKSVEALTPPISSEALAKNRKPASAPGDVPKPEEGVTMLPITQFRSVTP